MDIKPLVPEAIPDALIRIALNSGISVDEVLTLCQRWVYPLTWKLPDAIARADQKPLEWQAWCEHHDELLKLGYSWPLVRG